MSVIGWVFFGLIVGIVGKLLTPGRDPGGFIITSLSASPARCSAVLSANRWDFTSRESRPDLSWR